MVSLVPAERLDSADSLVKRLNQAVQGLGIAGSRRNRVASSCFGIALDHHHAIVVLLRQGLCASCFGLMRLEFEALVRGLWLNCCASDKQVESFAEGNNPPKMDVLINAVERFAGDANGGLSTVYGHMWHAMCGYTHTGGIHVGCWNTEDTIEPKYDPEVVLEVLRFAEIFATCAVVELAQIAGDASLAQWAQEQAEPLLPEQSN